MPIEAFDNHPVAFLDDLLDDALFALVFADEYFDAVAFEEGPVFYKEIKVLNNVL